VQALQRSTSRRRFLAGLGGLGTALLLDPRQAGAVLLPASESRAPRQAPQMDHLAWVWRFDQDGDREEIRRTLARHGLGITFKTHDGTNWMPDVGGRANGGPDRIAELARFFESGGVPFHAWCVVHGTDPVKEGRMAASVLSAGARSLTIDLEAHDGFWVGSGRDAERYGQELRRWQPDGLVLTSVDGRPWEIDRVPMDEFAAFSDGFSPQTYWNFFRGPINTRQYRDYYEDPGADGVTPAFVVDAAVRRLRPYNLPIYPIGDGTTADAREWRQFIERSRSHRAPALSVWRYGVTNSRVWSLLAGSPPAWQRAA
jgi:hypothetical protein